MGSLWGPWVSFNDLGLIWKLGYKQGKLPEVPKFQIPIPGASYYSRKSQCALQSVHPHRLPASGAVALPSPVADMAAQRVDR